MVESQLNQAVKEKVGYDISFQVSEVNVSINQKKASIHLNVDAEMDSTDFLKMMEKIALRKIKG